VALFGLDAHASRRPPASPAMRAMPAGAWPPSSPSSCLCASWA